MNRLTFNLLESRVFPWGVVLCFWAVNSVLAYGSFTLEQRLWIGTFGLILPAVLALRINSGKKSSGEVLVRGEVFEKIPGAAWIFLGITAVFLRFYQLTHLSLWPLEDEAMNAHYAVELAQKGNWQLTYDFSGMPPLYVWGLGLFFKFFGVSLTTLWFFPALFSSAAVGLAFAGARRFLSRSLSLLFTGFWAFSFWPLYLGRFSVQGGFLLFWMALTFYGLGIFVRAKGEKSELTTGFFLGLCAGAGFYTFTSWAVAAFLLTIFIFKKTVLGPERNWRRFFYFFTPQVLLFLILAWKTLADRGGHFFYVFLNPFGPGWPGLNDLCALFWGSRLPPNLFAYRSFEGGFLNPLLGALCFWGALVISKTGFSIGKQGILFFVLIIPGFLTGGLDGHRVVQCLPFLLFESAVGLASLVSKIEKPKRIFFAGAVLLFSCGLDARHLFSGYHSLWVQPKDNWFASKSVERLRAFRILEKMNREQGPGLVFSDLVPDIYDQSLSVLTHPFNASLNPEIPWNSCRWAGLLINVHFQTYLARQFPESRRFDLSSDFAPSDGGLMLWVIPLPSSNPLVLSRLIQADQVSHALAGLVFDNHDWKSQKPVLESLFSSYPLFKGDPLLETCFWEKIAECDYQDRDYAGQVEALQLAAARGIPAAHLFNGLGALFFRRGHWEGAKANFEKALLCKPNFTSAAEGLAALEKLEKTGVKPKD